MQFGRELVFQEAALPVFLSPPTHCQGHHLTFHEESKFLWDPPGLERRAGCVKGITTPIQEALQRAAPYADPGMTRR